MGVYEAILPCVALPGGPSVGLLSKGGGQGEDPVKMGKKKNKIRNGWGKKIRKHENENEQATGSLFIL